MRERNWSRVTGAIALSAAASMLAATLAGCRVDLPTDIEQLIDELDDGGDKVRVESEIDRRAGEAGGEWTVRSLKVSSTDGVVVLRWDPGPGTVEAFRIVRDGVTIAVLEADRRSYTDRTDGGGVHSYQVKVVGEPDRSSGSVVRSESIVSTGGGSARATNTIEIN